MRSPLLLLLLLLLFLLLLHRHLHREFLLVPVLLVVGSLGPFPSCSSFLKVCRFSPPGDSGSMRFRKR